MEAVGKNVTQFRPGDEVFGGRNGAYAEYVCARDGSGDRAEAGERDVRGSRRRSGGGVHRAAGPPRQRAARPGQKVLINGASGGVGTYAVQIAKALGGEVTAVCSTGNVEIARSLGADHVIDYTREDFTRSDRRYDLLLDVAGSRSWSACKRVLEPEGDRRPGRGPKTNRLLGPMGHMVSVSLGGDSAAAGRSSSSSRSSTRRTWRFCESFLESGKVRSVVDRRYELSEIADALEYIGEGHAKGKIRPLPCEAQLVDEVPWQT